MFINEDITRHTSAVLPASEYVQQSCLAASCWPQNSIYSGTKYTTDVLQDVFGFLATPAASGSNCILHLIADIAERYDGTVYRLQNSSRRAKQRISEFSIFGRNKYDRRRRLGWYGRWRIIGIGNCQQHCRATMENASLPSVVWDNITTSSSHSADATSHLAHIRDLVLKIIYVIIGTLGVVDNLFVLITFILFIKVTDKKINILLVNQSIIDMFASLFALLIALVEVDGTRMSRDSAWDQFVCRIWLSRNPLWCLLFTSTYGIILTALERYIAVVYPIWYKLKLKTRMVGGAIAFIWIAMPACGVMMAVLSTDIVRGRCIPWGAFSSYAVEKAIVSILICLDFLLPSMLMVACYSRIVYKLRERVNIAATAAAVKVGRNATITSLMVCCGFIVCWTPNQITFFLNFVGYPIDFGGWFYHFVCSLVSRLSVVSRLHAFDTVVLRPCGVR